MRGGAPPGSVASDGVTDAGIVFAAGGELGGHTLLSVGAKAGVLLAKVAGAGGAGWTPDSGVACVSSSGAAYRAWSERRCSRALIASWQTWQV